MSTFLNTPENDILIQIINRFCFMLYDKNGNFLSEVYFRETLEPLRKRGENLKLMETSENHEYFLFFDQADSVLCIFKLEDVYNELVNGVRSKEFNLHYEVELEKDK